MTRFLAPLSSLGQRAAWTIALALFLAASAAPPGYAAGVRDPKEHDRRAAQAREQARQEDEEAARLAGEIADIDRQIAAASAEVERLNPLVSEARERGTMLQTQVDAMVAEVTSAQDRIDVNTAENERRKTCWPNKHRPATARATGSTLRY